MENYKYILIIVITVDFIKSLVQQFDATSFFRLNIFFILFSYAETRFTLQLHTISPHFFYANIPDLK